MKNNPYNNLKAEMAYAGLRQKDLAEAIQLTEKALSNKITGKSEFTLPEARKIRDRFFKSMTVDYLFCGGEYAECEKTKLTPKEIQYEKLEFTSDEIKKIKKFLKNTILSD